MGGEYGFAVRLSVSRYGSRKWVVDAIFGFGVFHVVLGGGYPDGDSTGFSSEREASYGNSVMYGGKAFSRRYLRTELCGSGGSALFRSMRQGINFNSFAIV